MGALIVREQLHPTTALGTVNQVLERLLIEPLLDCEPRSDILENREVKQLEHDHGRGGRVQFSDSLD
jgi:hypothetical protein